MTQNEELTSYMYQIEQYKEQLNQLDMQSQYLQGQFRCALLLSVHFLTCTFLLKFLILFMVQELQQLLLFSLPLLSVDYYSHSPVHLRLIAPHQYR